MTLTETIEHLKYIINSPNHLNGGFHPNTVEIAKNALKYLEQLKVIQKIVKEKE